MLHEKKAPIIHSLREYQTAAKTTALDLARSSAWYCALGLTGEAGEVAENIKKMYRDGEGVLTPVRKDGIKKELGDVLWYISALASWCDLDLQEIAQGNVDKLFARKARGNLHGDGDMR